MVVVVVALAAWVVALVGEVVGGEALAGLVASVVAEGALEALVALVAACKVGGWVVRVVVLALWLAWHVLCCNMPYGVHVCHGRCVQSALRSGGKQWPRPAMRRAGPICMRGWCWQDGMCCCCEQQVQTYLGLGGGLGGLGGGGGD